MVLRDPREQGLKSGLRQLTAQQIERLLAYDKEMVLDRWNYEDGKFCPLAVAVGLTEMPDPTHDRVFGALTRMGFKVFNTRGLVGRFYTTNRLQDLQTAAKEILEEKRLDAARP